VRLFTCLILILSMTLMARADTHIDYSDYMHPIASLPIPDEHANSVTVHGDIAFVAADAGCYVVDISQPTTLSIITFIATGCARDLVIDGNLAYVVGDGAELTVVDIADPTEPEIIGHYVTPGSSSRVDIDGGYAYIADGVTGLLVIDISDPTDPFIAGELQSSYGGADVVVRDGWAFLAKRSYGIHIIDVSDPPHPEYVTQIGGKSINTIDIQGDLLYYPDDEFGMRIYNIANPAEPVYVSHIYTSGFSDVKVVGSFAYLLGGPGLEIVDVDDAANPVLLVDLHIMSAVRMAIDGDLVYVATHEHPFLWVIDASNPRLPPDVGTVDTDDYAHGLSIQGNLVYLADDDGGLQVIDITIPSAPQVIGRSDVATSAKDVVARGDLAFVADYYLGLVVFDIKTPDMPQHLATLSTAGSPRALAQVDDMIFIADTVGLTIVDVSDPADPALVGSLETPNTASDICVEDDLAFVAGYAGLSVIDISHASTPEIISFVDEEIGEVCVVGDLVYATGFNTFNVIDIADPYTPVILAETYLPGCIFDLAVSGDHAYIANGDCAMVVIDITDRFAPTVIGCSSWIYGLHYRIELNEEYAFVANGPRGLRILNKQVPAIVAAPEASPISAHALMQNHPNPFNPQTTIKYELPEQIPVTLRVFDLAGRLVYVLVEGEETAAGSHTATWTGQDAQGRAAPSGTYFYRLEAGGFVETRRMTLIR